jgi:hypothetical protein
MRPDVTRASQRPTVGDAGRVMPPEGNDWQTRHLKAQLCVLPWIEQTMPLRGKTVFEYGCGNAPVTCALGSRADQAIGVDIDGGAIEAGREAVTARGLGNVELIAVPVRDIAARVADLAAGVDVFLFYAVLEHMTISERLELLGVARGAVNAGGAIVVCELPNRLLPFDAHSSGLPFFDQLPNELALGYYERSPRKDFREAMDAVRDAAPERASERLARWGRGGSYHEFELAFGDLSQHVMASNYDELMMPVRGLVDGERALAETLQRFRPDLAPAWSRYWQDVILSAVPLAAPPRPMIRPHSFYELHGHGSRLLPGGTVEVLAGATLTVALPAASARFLIGANADTDHLGIELASGGVTASASVPVWRSRADTRYATLEMPVAVESVQLRFDAPGYLVFFGYAA